MIVRSSEGRAAEDEEERRGATGTYRLSRKDGETTRQRNMLIAMESGRVCS